MSFAWQCKRCHLIMDDNPRSCPNCGYTIYIPLDKTGDIYRARKAEVNMTQPEEQPMPTPNDAPSVQGMVIDDLRTRLAVGIERYGTPLQPHNGRDALRDAYEEALDLACYLRQAIAERATVATLPETIEPWTITVPTGRVLEMARARAGLPPETAEAWVDTDNQQRWLHPDRVVYAREKGWRRLYIEKAQPSAPVQDV